jgi:hypothetical protein
MQDIIEKNRKKQNIDAAKQGSKEMELEVMEAMRED